MKVSVQTWFLGFRWVSLLLALSLAGGSAAPATAADATERFDDPEVVQKVHLEIKLEDLDRLHRSLPQRIYVPGSFRWNDQVLTNVGVRFKGNSSSMPDSPFKRGYLIDFAEFQKGQRLLGLRPANVILLESGMGWEQGETGADWKAMAAGVNAAPRNLTRAMRGHTR